MTTLLCPLCSQSRFDNLEALRVRLVTAATQNITCPVCSESLLGLDKFTIHLFGHTLTVRQEEPTPAQIEVKQDLLDDTLCTVNMEDLSFLTSWENCCKSVGTITADRPIFDKSDVSYTVNMKADEPKNNMIYTPRIEQRNCSNFGCEDLEKRSVNTAEHSCQTVAEPDQRDAISQVDQNDIVTCTSSLSSSTNLSIGATLLTDIGAVSSVILPPISFVETSDKIERSVNETTCHFFDVENSHSNSSPPDSPPKSKMENKELSEYMSELLKQKLMTPSLLLETQPSNELIKSETDNSDVNDLKIDATVLDNFLQTSQPTPESYDCRICGRGFKMRGSLLVHTRVAHGGLGIETMNQELRNFHCTICSKSFKKEQHLTQHMKTHDGKQWQCETCSKYFTTKYFLKKHQRLHTGEMPYCCETCKKTFTFQQSYHKHLLYHSADKPHECQECGRSFKELSTLHNHQRIHSGEKPFACEICGKCFRQRVSYIVHQRIHTGVLPYQCTACKKKFRYKVSQRSHKCAAQPPGVVVRQPGDLIQRILEQRQNILRCLE